MSGSTRPGRTSRAPGSTAWELAQAGVPHTLIPDVAAGHLMARGEVDVILVGADRVAANGDTANKVGTYPLAVLAARHGIPFYVCAPTSSVDLATPDGDAIPIEERKADEVLSRPRRPHRAAGHRRSATRRSMSRRPSSSPGSSPRRASSAVRSGRWPPRRDRQRRRVARSTAAAAVPADRRRPPTRARARREAG